MNKKIVILLAILILVISIIAFCTYDKRKIKVDSIKTDKELKQITFNKEEDVFDNDCVGVLKIEKIGLSATVKEGSNSNILEEYIGHIEETPLYDGNIGLAAHNRGNRFSYFARLNELEIGDEVSYITKYNTKKYEVIDKRVILETDWTMLKDTKENRITMITCIKNKTNQRLCVQALESKRKDDNYEKND